MNIKNKKTLLLIFLLFLQSVQLRANPENDGVKKVLNQMFYIGCGAAVFMLGYCAYRMYHISNGTYRYGDRKLENSTAVKEYELKNQDYTIKINNFQGNVNVNGTDENKLIIESTKYFHRGCEDKIQVNSVISNDDNTIDITTIFLNTMIRNQRVDLNLQVPKNLQVTVKTRNSSVNVANVSEAEAKTSNGSIQVNTVPRILAKTTNGFITIIDADDVDAQTSNGYIDAKGIKHSLSAKAGRGHIIAFLVGHVIKVDLQTDNGKIKLTLPKSYGGNVFARTINGKITSDFIQSANDVVNVKTSNGYIKIKKAKD